jgi:ribosomal 50S subunit-recycling heat shock protein
LRLDKFLKNSRLIKRRTVAKEACDEQRVSVNGKTAKAGTELKEGDIVRIEFGTGSITVKVNAMPETVRKEDAVTMYSVLEDK